ncbi:MAG: hypothetical protein A3H51_00135 [Candidatus Spechtbacteria bacterium RIFCSPLOWO2_02_FULL_38_8]|uniref:FtsK domain-containing protein n=1 Tax=Candidatus Spechtbacteria bacterium RIFCSPLOWO2_02_FULL_38_8 TaxID=1802164 RepID=A0A1G2HHA2_9BACT|nr:MAG: hypothetical protein A3H51_00135 [Candidatus Spechtbacteria bacterium RIFCSPLOWO2_02_FULL_38_8]
MAKKRKKFSSKPKKEVKDNKLNPEVSKSIWAIILTVVSVLSVLSFFNKAGSFGSLIKNILNFTAGWGMYVAPVVFLGMAVMFIISWERNTSKSIVFSVFLFFSSLLGIFALTDYVRETAIIRGGYWGYLFAWPIVKFLGVLGAFIILFAFLFIAVIVGFHVRLGEIFSNFREQKRLRKSAFEFETENSHKTSKEGQGGEAVDIKDYNISGEVEKKKEKKDGEEFAAHSSKNIQFKDFKLPTFNLLDQDTGKPTSGDIVANANIIKRTLQNFGMDVEMGEVNVGPTVTQYTLKPAEGVKLSRITALNNDLSLALAAHPIRIEAPIPGRSLVGIEIPNKASTQVRLGSLLMHDRFKEFPGDLVLAMGRDVKGSPVYTDVSRMPHMLVAGSTGSGKTIALNALILSLIYKNPPQLLRFILIDPKRVEFPIYAGIPHLLAPIVVDNNKAVNALKWAVGEMERRFEVLSDAKERDIQSYNSNKKVIKSNEILPYILIIIDELADLMSSKGKEVEALIVRIAQMARAVGIHLVLATQRPSVEIVTGLIKANITSRVAFQVGSQVDSRTVLDMAGAERLLGRGDMLFLSPESSKPIRVQGSYVSQQEIKRTTDYLRNQKETMNDGEEVEDFNETIRSSSTSHSINLDNIESDMEDELYEDAKALVIKQQKGSASYLQRRLRVGYARAARLLDMLEENGIVGPVDGAKPRDVYVVPEDLEDDKYHDKDEYIE